MFYANYTFIFPCTDAHKLVYFCIEDNSYAF